MVNDQRINTRPSKLIMDVQTRSTAKLKRQSILDYRPPPIARQPIQRKPVSPSPTYSQKPKPPSPRPSPTKASDRTYSTPKRAKWTKINWRDMLASGFIALVLIAAQFFVEAVRAQPGFIVLIYAVLAIILKVSSKKAFAIALILLVAAPLLFALDQPTLAEGYVRFSFLFLAAGLVIYGSEAYSHRQEIVR